MESGIECVVLRSARILDPCWYYDKRVHVNKRLSSCAMCMNEDKVELFLKGTDQILALELNEPYSLVFKLNKMLPFLLLSSCI